MYYVPTSTTTQQPPSTVVRYIVTTTANVTGGYEGPWSYASPVNLNAPAIRVRRFKRPPHRPDVRVRRLELVVRSPPRAMAWFATVAR